MADGFSDQPVGSPVQPCPLQKVKPPHWVAIELMGEDGKGIPYEQYRITLPDNTQRTGLLDKDGRARVEGLPDPGTCSITFPRLDTDAWQFTESKGV